MAPTWPEEEKATLAVVPCAPQPARPSIPPVLPPPIPWRTEALTSGRIQPAILHEVLPHLSARSCGIECCEVGDFCASLRKRKASSGAFEGQVQDPCPPQQLYNTTDCMLPSNVNSKLIHLLKLHPELLSWHPPPKTVPSGKSCPIPAAALAQSAEAQC